MAAILSYEGGIGVRNGCFCAHTYVKSLRNVGGDEAKRLEDEMKKRDRSNILGTIRASFGIYNNRDEIERFCRVLEKIISDGHFGQYFINREKGEYFPRNHSFDLERYIKF